MLRELTDTGEFACPQPVLTRGRAVFTGHASHSSAAMRAVNTGMSGYGCVAAALPW
jgi:hypothetical protein